MGKRTNTILQSAFFTLAKIMPEEDAIAYMKDSGQEVLPEEGPGRCRYELHAPSTPARRPSVKVDVPGRLGQRCRRLRRCCQADRQAELWSSMVKDIMFPVGKMDGDSLPVSTFMDYVDGQFELGASAYEKRGVAVTVPEWDPRKVHPVQQLRLCLPARDDPSLRSDRRRSEERPRCCEDRSGQGWQGQGRLLLHDGHLPAGLHGLRRLRRRLPDQVRWPWFRRSRQLPQQDVFDYAVAEVSEKTDMQDNTVKGSQFKQPHAGILRLLRRLRRDVLCPPRDPALRRQNVYLQRDRLFLHLGRPRRDLSLLHQQGRPRTRLVQLPV